MNSRSVAGASGSRYSDHYKKSSDSGSSSSAIKRYHADSPTLSSSPLRYPSNKTTRGAAYEKDRGGGGKVYQIAIIRLLNFCLQFSLI